MKFFLLKSILFISGIVIINIAYLFIIQSTDWGFIKRKESLNFVNPKFDVLVIGNSLAMDGIDTEVLTNYGFNSYNLAIPGSSVKTSYIQLEEYLKTYSNRPKYVILGLGSFIGSFSGEDIHPIVEFTMEDYRFKLNDLPLIKFKWLGIEFLKKIVSKNHRDAYFKFGQLRFEKTIADITTINNLNTFNKKDYVDSKWVQKIIDLCSNNKIKVLVVEMPGFKSTRNNENSEIVVLNNNNASNNGFLYNFNSIEFCKIFDDNKDWIGNSHLNAFGAKKFTEQMLKVFECTNSQHGFGKK